MPWLAFDFDDPQMKQIAMQLKVRKVPHLLVIDTHGQVLCYNGVEHVIIEGLIYF